MTDTDKTMQITVEERSPVEKTLKLEIPWARVSEDFKSQVAKLAKTVRIKGFRPGKAPSRVVENVYGPRVRSDLGIRLFEEGMVKATQEHGLTIVAEPDLENVEMESNQTWSFTARVEVQPKLDTIVIAGLKAERPSAEVEESEVEEALERIRSQHAELRSPEPARPAQDGDVVTISGTFSVAGERREDLDIQDYSVTLGDGRIFEEIESALPGMAVDEEKTVSLTFPEEQSDPALAGKASEIVLKVTRIQERVLPELDDEFAKDAGDYENLEALRANLREKKATEKRNESDQAFRRAVIDGLVELNPITVPPSLLQRQKEQLSQQQRMIAQMLGQPPAPEDDAQLTESATKQLRAAFIMGALAKRENISVDPDEIEAKVQEMAAQRSQHPAKIRADMQRHGELKRLENDLLEAKLVAYAAKEAGLEG